MELPPAGWYPDPYGTPDLLRWWDGSGWTQHTHASLTPQGGDSGQAAASAQQPAVTTGQPATGQPATVQPATVQPSTVQPGPVQPSPVQPTAVQPTAVQPTAYQPPVTAVQPAAVQPTTFQPATGRPSSVQATRVDGTVPPMGGQGGDPSGTQVLFMGGDAWAAPGMAGSPAGMYGYQRAQQERRRRMIMAGALAGGTLAALAVIAIVVNAMGSSGATTQQPPVTASAAATSAATASISPSPTSSTATPPADVLTDGASGLSYVQLPSWQASCPSSLSNGALSWTAGESAVAGQVNQGQTTWYGEACSGQLPQSYGYGGVSTLPSVTSNLANTLANADYNALAHNVTMQVSQPVQVSGHAGWEVKFLVSYTDTAGQGVGFPEEQAAVVVADAGAGLAPSVFFASIPATLGESNVDSLVSSLQLNPVPQPGGSPGDGGSPADGGSPPGDGGNNP